MPKFVKRAVLLGIVLAAPQFGWSEDRDFPVMNSIGRFWGIGYTRGGYHATQDGRFDVVTSHHPSSNYRIGGSPQYAQPLYSPPSRAMPMPLSTSSPTVAPNSEGTKKADDTKKGDDKSNSKPGSESAPPEAIAPPKPVAPPKPTEPPPRWLEDYLKGDESAAGHGVQNPQGNILVEPTAPESSPSDLLPEELRDGSSEEIDLGKEISFDFFDASYSRGGDGNSAGQRPLARVPRPASIAPRVNRYR